MTTSDEQALLDLHRDWTYSNLNINIPLMQSVFPQGDETFQMFNLNGHAYFGVNELTALWAGFVSTHNFGLAEDRVMRVEVSGDMGYVTSEGVFSLVTIASPEGDPLPSDQFIELAIPFRSTEVYRRDNGAGDPVWTMWHFHCSASAPTDEVPTSKSATSTIDARGFGNTPYSSGIDNDYSPYQ